MDNLHKIWSISWCADNTAIDAGRSK